MDTQRLKSLVRTIPDFPKEGIMFRDITTVLKDGWGMKTAIDEMSQKLRDKEFDLVIGPESRGFIFATPLAYNMNKGFVLARKAGKLPAETIAKSFELEYGEAIIEIHKDAIKKGDKIVIVDDLLATGGTCKAVCELVKEFGATVVAAVFLIELPEINGRKNLEDYCEVHSILKY